MGAETGVAELVCGLALVLFLAPFAGVPEPDVVLDMPGVVIGGLDIEGLFGACPENDGRWKEGAEAEGLAAPSLFAC